jgi:hypothetical protein
LLAVKALTIPATICNHLEPSGTIWNHLELSGTIWNHLELSGTKGKTLLINEPTSSFRSDTNYLREEILSFADFQLNARYLYTYTILQAGLPLLQFPFFDFPEA